MTYEIYSDGELVNSIVASEEFVKTYCDANGYTFSERAEAPASASAPEPSTDDLLNILLGVGT